MAASEEQLARLAGAYQKSLAQMAANHEHVASTVWRHLPRVGTVEVKAFVRAMEGRTVATRTEAVRLSATFFDYYVAAASGELVLEDPIDVERAVARVRAGAPLEQVFADPIQRAEMLGSEMSGRDAVFATAERVGQIADQDVTLAAREGTAAAAQRYQIPRFLRRPEPMACDFCQTAAKQVYKRPDLRPIHGNCHCIVIPLVGATTPQTHLPA